MPMINLIEGVNQALAHELQHDSIDRLVEYDKD